jgi:CheY-like chemotaxis protein
VRNALQAAERGANLTSQLLAFSRRQRLSPVALDINAVIYGMRDLLVRSIGPRVEIGTELHEDVWPALADPTQLEVMLLNLAINARDAMVSGGQIVISTKNVLTLPEQLAEELNNGEYVCISVSDDGPGMSPDVLAHAFEPFFTTKAHGKGTGLGLAQLYGFARQSGGTAKIESELGHGTTVSIYLPRTHELVRRDAVSRSNTQATHPAKILVLDDDDDVRTVTCETIRELGYEVVALGDPAEALRRLTDEHFDLLITDVAMPGITGVEVAREVRSKGDAIPILFSSGYADVQVFGEELLEEVVLRKPFRLTDIAARIEAALEPAPAPEAASA